MSITGTSIETESRLVVAKGLIREVNGIGNIVITQGGAVGAAAVKRVQGFFLG